MEVPIYWSPDINWNQFSRGTVSDDVWQQFKNLVRLSHCFKHWAEEARNYRGSGTPATKESDYQRRRRLAENKSERNQLEERKFEAAFEAAGQALHIREIASKRPASVDEKLWFALKLSLGEEFITNRITGHHYTQFDVLAFDKFNTESELNGEPAAIAERWRLQNR